MIFYENEYDNTVYYFSFAYKITLVEISLFSIIQNISDSFKMVRGNFADNVAK